MLGVEHADTEKLLVAEPELVEDPIPRVAVGMAGVAVGASTEEEGQEDGVALSLPPPPNAGSRVPLTVPLGEPETDPI